MLIYSESQKRLLDEKYKELSETTISKKLISEYKPIVKKYKSLVLLFQTQSNLNSVKDMAKKLIYLARSDDRFLLDMNSKVQKFSKEFKLKDIPTELIENAILEVYKMDMEYFGVKGMDSSFDEQTRQACRDFFIDGISEYESLVNNPELQKLLKDVFQEEIKSFESKETSKPSEILLKNMRLSHVFCFIKKL